MARKKRIKGYTIARKQGIDIRRDCARMSKITVRDDAYVIWQLNNKRWGLLTPDNYVFVFVDAEAAHTHISQLVGE